MAEIRVVEVRRRDGKAVSVAIDIEGILFCFYRKRGGGVSFTKSKPDAQVRDENELWVPDELFTKACRQAAAILYQSAVKHAKLPLAKSAEPALNPKNGWRKKERSLSETFRRPACRRGKPVQVNQATPLLF